jgi:hypothetical protein
VGVDLPPPGARDFYLAYASSSISGTLAPGDRIDFQFDASVDVVGIGGGITIGGYVFSFGGSITDPGSFSRSRSDSPVLVAEYPSGSPISGFLMHYNGHVIVYKGDGGGQTTFNVDPGLSISAVPEPSSLVLLITGAACLLAGVGRSARDGASWLRC